MNVGLCLLDWYQKTDYILEGDDAETQCSRVSRRWLKYLQTKRAGDKSYKKQRKNGSNENKARSGECGTLQNKQKERP